MATPQTPSTVYFIQAQPFILNGSGTSIGDTTILLQSFTNIDGSNIVTADLGSFAFATLEPGNGVQEEAILFTGVTQNANGTATLTGVSSVGFLTPYTVTSGLTKTHAGASKLILSNDAAFYNNLILYLNDIAGAGAANASTTVKGIVQAATATNINNSTPTGTTGAVLAMTPDAFSNSTSGSYLNSVRNSGIPFTTATGTSSAFTATLASAVSTLASGTYFNVLFQTTNASGATLDVNSIGAKPLKKAYSTSVASGEIIPGQISTLVYDGVGFQVKSPSSLAPRIITYTSGTATYIKPSGLKYVMAEVVGGGGSGATAGSDDVASGGGGGGYSRKMISASSIGSTETVTVGAATATSSFGSHCSATGGANGSGNGTPGVGGVGSGGDLNITGGYGHSGSYSGASNQDPEAGGNGGNNPLGFGGAGGTGNNGQNGIAGTNYGGGGGGGYDSNPGGAGASGVVIVTEYFS